ncbi:MAG: hypothetical protein ACWGSQ_04165 [Longimicrobiales bacterium]
MRFRMDDGVSSWRLATLPSRLRGMRTTAMRRSGSLASARAHFGAEGAMRTAGEETWGRERRASPDFPPTARPLF